MNLILGSKICGDVLVVPETGSGRLESCLRNRWNFARDQLESPVLKAGYPSSAASHSRRKSAPHRNPCPENQAFRHAAAGRGHLPRGRFGPGGVDSATGRIRSLSS